MSGKGEKSKELALPVIAGLLASGLFLFVFGVGLGFVFLFLPTLPLFYVGLSKAHRYLPISIAIAATLIALPTDVSMSILFLFFLGIPSWYLSKCALRSRNIEGTVQWFSLGTTLLYLTLYSCTVIAFITGFYATTETNLPHLLSNTIHSSFADMQEEFGEVVDELAGPFSFLIFPVTVWLWGILLYLHGWIANRMLIQNNLQLRTDFSIQVFTMPSWMLSLLAISGLASMIGGESIAFLGKTCMIALMLPYFFLGLSLLHRASSLAANRKLILFIVYFCIVSQFWPALILSAYGLGYQLKNLYGPSVLK